MRRQLASRDFWDPVEIYSNRFFLRATLNNDGINKTRPHSPFLAHLATKKTSDVDVGTSCSINRAHPPFSQFYTIAGLISRDIRKHALQRNGGLSLSPAQKQRREAMRPSETQCRKAKNHRRGKWGLWDKETNPPSGRRKRATNWKPGDPVKLNGKSEDWLEGYGRVPTTQRVQILVFLASLHVS